MKWWAISVLLILMICLTLPIVTAESKGGKITKVSTPAKVDKKSVDSLAPVKKLVGWKTDDHIEITINGKKAAILPPNSPLLDIPVTNECVAQYPYGSLNWYNCEVAP